MLAAIRVISIAGLVLFGPVFLATALAPTAVEQAAKSYVKAKAKSEADRYLESFAGRALAKTYEALDKRHVRKDGTVKWHGRMVYINENLAGEWLALEEIADGLCELRYGPITLGHLKPRGSKLIRNTAGRGLVDNAKALPTTPPPQQPRHRENK